MLPIVFGVDIHHCVVYLSCHAVTAGRSFHRLFNYPGVHSIHDHLCILNGKMYLTAWDAVDSNYLWFTVSIRWSADEAGVKSIYTLLDIIQASPFRKYIFLMQIFQDETFKTNQYLQFGFFSATLQLSCC